MKSRAERLRDLSPEDKANLLASLSEEERAALAYSWDFWARPKQLPPENLRGVWLILAGRGFGKTRTGAEFIKDAVYNKGYRNPLLVAPIAGDVRDVMVEGESGLLSIFNPRIDPPTYQPSKKRLIFHNVGDKGEDVVCALRSADKPDGLRGGNYDCFWYDELCAWRYMKEAFDVAKFAMRLGSNPMGIITTTPKPIQFIRDLVKQRNVTVTRGSLYENKGNLSSQFIEEVKQQYEGTRLAQQEIYGEILDDLEGALWRPSQIEELRVDKAPMKAHRQRIVIGVDPAVTSNERSDCTGIMVCMVSSHDKHAYVLEDASIVGTPSQWAHRVVEMYSKWEADCIVAEVNQGGDLVESNMRAIESTLPIKQVRATKGKILRAEPIAALYEQFRVHHVGTFPQLEEEMVCYTGLATEKSPDRLDALVWALQELLIQMRSGTIEDDMMASNVDYLGVGGAAW